MPEETFWAIWAPTRERNKDQRDTSGRLGICLFADSLWRGHNQSTCDSHTNCAVLLWWVNITQPTQFKSSSKVPHPDTQRKWLCSLVIELFWHEWGCHCPTNPEGTMKVGQKAGCQHLWQVYFLYSKASGLPAQSCVLHGEAVKVKSSLVSHDRSPHQADVNIKHHQAQRHRLGTGHPGFLLSPWSVAGPRKGAWQALRSSGQCWP